MRASSAGTGLTIDVSFGHVGAAREPKRGGTWLLVACAMTAAIAAGAAFTESPLGRHPAVRPYTDVVRAEVVAAKATVMQIAHEGLSR